MTHWMITSNHNALRIRRISGANLRRAGGVCPKKAKICLLSRGKSQIDTSQVQTMHPAPFLTTLWVTFNMRQFVMGKNY